MPKTVYVFVSYAHSDRAYVARLRTFLEDHGVRVWLDESIANGERWVTKLRDRIDQSAAVVVVMSPAAEASEWVDNELHRARQRGKPVLPLLLAGEPFFRLGGLQYEDVTGGQLPTAGFVASLTAVVAERPEPAAPGVPIEQHSMLANGQTVALLTPEARVTWFCYPSPDSPPIFADLLGGPSAGHFSIAPAEGRLVGQRYLDSTMTVETRWTTLTVTDWLHAWPGTTGRSATSLMRVLTGACEVRIEFVPRPRFGQTAAALTVTPHGLQVRIGTEVSVLHSPSVRWSIQDDAAVGTADLAETGVILLDFRCGGRAVDLPPASPADELIVAGGQPWRDWSSALDLPAVAPAETLRSALTLRGLYHRPTGAFLAAVTTSLPEAVGAGRNWDYRYCWIRDGSMSARELVRLGSSTEAEALLRWIDGCVTRTDGHPERLHPLYTLDGRELGLQAEIVTMSGHLGSLPVRVGNLADGQIQRDIFGPVVDLIAAVVEARAAGDQPGLLVEEHEWRLMIAMVDAVSVGWNDPDHGIWEFLQPPYHHVHSKVMCWWALTRAVDVATITGRQDAETATWTRLAEIIRDDVLTNGWNERLTSFTEGYASADLDAATLWVGLSGMIPADDRRFHATVHAVEQHLRHGPTVYRYTLDDGIEGKEGGFNLCTTWLIEAYLRTGRIAEAHDLFRQYLALAGPTGLLPEMYDPAHHLSLGNHPMAYSHLGLIRCATLLDRHAVPQ